MDDLRGAQQPPRPIREIESYHAHIYFDGPGQRERMQLLRSRIAERFRVQITDVIEESMGVHPKPMVVVAFPPDLFGALVPWLMLNRLGLPILLHPNTDNALHDHLVQAAWLGGELKLKSNAELPEARQLATSLKARGLSQPPVVTNTAPTSTFDV